MKNKKLKVKMFGQEDTVSVEFYDRADKALVESIIKENLIRRVKQENYSAVSEPVITEHKYLKQIGEAFMPVYDKTEADLIIFHTTVKVVEKDSK